MASEIKIQLATYLKDAGIKATQQQVDRLARNVRGMNRDMQADARRVESALGRLPGVFGKIQSAASGAFGTALAVAGAFKVGCDIGNWIHERVIAPLFGIKDPIEELKKENRELQREAENAAAKWEEALTKWAAGWESEVSGAEKARQKIEDLTQAYLKMQAARERIQAAGDNAKLLGMERDKFDAMAGASSPEEAAALGKYHDVLIAEEKSKQQLAKFDRDSETAARKQASAEEQLLKARDKRAHLTRQMAELDRKLAYMQSQQSVQDLGFEQSSKEEEKLLQRKEALQAKIDAANRDVASRKADVAALRESRTAEDQERQNLVEKAKLEVDERKKAYEDYVAYVERCDAEAAEAEWQRKQEEIRSAAELELRERERVERELAAQRIADLRKELSEQQRMESEARARQGSAAGSLQTAWRWYRDKNQMQAVIDERKAQAAAEVQWQKDFERLKTWRRDWRTAEFGSLSAADESVRQVALAKEEKAAADRAVLETAENTRDLAEKLDELLAMK